MRADDMAEAPITEEGLDWGEHEDVLTELVAFLKARDYSFVTTTPATHARILSRHGTRLALNLRDIFGWSMPFLPNLLDSSLSARLVDAGIVVGAGGELKSRLRVSSLGPDLFLHSAYPTHDKNAVFLGPDSYRFARLIAQDLGPCARRPSARLLDIGTGAGVGAIVAAHLYPTVDILMTDINPAALQLARINAKLAGVASTGYLASDLASLDGEFDVILANPPFIIDDAGRAYRDGGEMHGAAVSLEMAAQAVARLAPGGRLILYTGSAIVNGNDALCESLAALARKHDCTLGYAEIDPDIFGEELDMAAYRDVERIALVSAVIERPGGGGWA